MNNTTIKKLVQQSRFFSHTTFAVAALFSVAVVAAPDITAPADVIVPGAETPSIAPVYVLDLENTIAPDGINVTDPLCGTLNANPTGLLGPVSSGRHMVTWTAVCNTVSNSVDQNIDVIPQVNFVTDQKVGEGSLTISNTATVTVELSGPAPSYPVNIPYTLSGTTTPEEEATADAPADHDAKEGSIEITSGTRGSYTFNVFQDGNADARETLIFTLATAQLPDTVSPGLNTRHTITFLDTNTGATVEIIAQQNGQDTRTIIATDGLVEVRARINDRSPLASSPKFDWSDTDAALTPPTEITNTDPLFSFDPASLTPGFYRIKLSYNENQWRTDQELLLSVLAASPTLAIGDTDNDGLSNSAESIYDSDNDGVVNYLDAINDKKRLQASGIQTFNSTATLSDTLNSSGFDISWQINNGVSNQVAYPDLIVTEPGLRVTLGETAFQLGLNHARVPITALEPYVEFMPDSALGSIDQHVIDFVIHDLPGTLSAYVVIPQTIPLPKPEFSPLTLQHYNLNNVWEAFTTLGSSNALASAPRNTDGYCPPPGSDTYNNGMKEGDQCIQLYIEDNGANDHDKKTNGSIHFMGAIFASRLANCDCTLETSSSLLSENNYPDPVLDDLYSIDGYVTQTIVTDAPANSIDMVIPLDTNLPLANSGPLTFYIYTNSGTWEALQINATSAVASAPRDSQGFCPHPGSVSYVGGIHDGDGCIQITMTDNDPRYDRDSTVGTIDIVSGIFIAKQREPDLPVLDIPPANLTGSLARTPAIPVTILDFASTVIPTSFQISDLTSGNSTVEPSGELGPLAPGKHTLTWQIKDLGNNTISHEQTIDVVPRVNFAVDQNASNGSTATISAYLNGSAANYPVTVPFVFAGNNYQINIASGRSGSVDVAIGAGNSPGDVLSATMGTPSNALLGTKTSHSITLTATDIAPSINLSSSQNGTGTRNILINGGPVIITASATQASAALSYDWSNSDSELVPLSGTSGSHFSFDPATLAKGLYTITLNINDGSNSSQRDLLLRVIDSAPAALSDSTDTDDDRRSDLSESIADKDHDGIVDYLDAITTPEWIQAWPVGVYKTGLADARAFISDNFKIDWSIASLASNQVAYSLLVTTDPGLKLSLGPTAFISDTNHARVLVQDAVNIIGSAYSSNITSADGYVINVEISQLPSPGQTVTLYIPQTAPLPPGPAGITTPLAEGQPGFFVYAQDAWGPLNTLDADSVASQIKSSDYCPTTDTANINGPTDNYDTGLSTNYECIRLTLTDGGPNDSDGRVNGSIRLLGGVFINSNKEDPPEPEPYPEEFDTAAQSQTEQRNDGGSGGGSGALGWLMLLIAGWGLSWRRATSRSQATDTLSHTRL